ncbi:MAG: NAD-dependent deacylase [Ardenticatenaceae bacterium]|nr:NAD-dependent deacylase [Ardenticatenaceae bacterium]
MNDHLAGQIRRANDILSTARSAVALTGAGVSTPSGIPDFRSPESGFWTMNNPMDVASLPGFKRQPESFYKWVRPLIDLSLSAIPNPAHYALRDLELHGPLSGIITQNIDWLHTQAGSKTVYEVHGHMREMHCLVCGAETPAEKHLRQLSEAGILPVCQSCGSIIKPKLILFGEMLPYDILLNAEKLANQCDAMIIAGSSLSVAPANELPWLARRNNAKIIIVNLTPTHMDDFADVVIRGDVAEVLPRLAHPFRPKET